MAFIVSAVTGLAVSTVVAGAGVALGAYGAYKSSKQNKVSRGKDAISDQKKATIRSLSSVRSGTAGAGLVVDGADTTGQLLVKSMAEAGELDIIRLQENIDREEQRALDQGANFTAQSDQFKIQQRGYNPLLSGITAGVSGASRNADILFPT